MPLLRRKTSTLPVPGGLIAHTEKGYFLVKGGKRFKFVSDRARDSWNLKVIHTSEDAMSNIRVNGIIGFRDGSLIRDISNFKVYLISEYKKRHIVSPDVLKEFGFKIKDIVLVGAKEAAVHQDGEPINA